MNFREVGLWFVREGAGKRGKGEEGGLEGSSEEGMVAKELKRRLSRRGIPRWKPRLQHKT